MVYFPKCIISYLMIGTIYLFINPGKGPKYINERHSINVEN